MILQDYFDILLNVVFFCFMRVDIVLIKVAQSNCLIFFSNFLRFGYHQEVLSLLIIFGEFYSSKMYCLEDVNENINFPRQKKVLCM